MQSAQQVSEFRSIVHYTMKFILQLVNQLSDPRLTSVIYRSKVFNGRYQKQVSFKSIDDLVAFVERDWPVLRQCNYSLHLKTNTLVPIIDLSMLKAYPEENQIVVKKDLTGFSKVSKERANAEVGAVLDDLEMEHIKPIDIINPEFINITSIRDTAGLIGRDLLVRMKVLHHNLTSEYTKREFISPILIYSVQLVIDRLRSDNNMKPLLLVCEKEILGKRFHGPVDYSLMYEIVDIVLTEAKRIDLEQGILQNLLQQRASQEFLANAFVNENLTGKRYREVAELNYKDISRMPTYGIVSTGEKWTFLKFYHQPSNQIYQSDVYQVNLQHRHCSSHFDAFVDSIAVLLRFIIGIIYDQITWIESHEGVWKRQKIDLDAILRRESTLSSHVEDDDNDE